jgi:copper transport protein
VEKASMSTLIGSFGLRVFAGFLLAFVLSLPALAHAEFRGSDPAQDSLLDAMPDAVTLQFSEQVGVLVLDWRLPDGSILAASGQAGAEALVVQPPPDGGRGTYVLRWRVASADGHPVGGALVFSVGMVSGAGTEPTGDPGGATVVIARGMFVAILVLLVGAAVFHHAVAPLSAGLARMTSPLAGLILPLGLIWIAAEGAERLGLGFGAAFSASTLTAGLQSPVLYTVILSALAALLVFAAVQAGSRVAAIASLALAALSFAVSGHALSAPGSFAPALTAIHAGAILVWVGGLIPLALAMQGQDRLIVLRRFSAIALPAVVVLIGSGSALALLHWGSPDLLASAWARLLAVKLVLVAAMLAFALWHQFRTMPQLARGKVTPVQRSVAIEASLGVIVLALAMGFRLAPPPSISGPARADSVSIHIHTDKVMIDLAATAAFPGQTGFVLNIVDGDFAPLDPQEVTVSLTDQVAGIGPLSVAAAKVGLGHWEVPQQTLPTPGPWEVRITLLISDFEQIRVTGSLPVATAE